MSTSAASQLVDPFDRNEPLKRQGDVLVSAAGRQYPVVGGIPRFVSTSDAGQSQTADSFGYKWTRSPQWGFKPEHQEPLWQYWREIFNWSEREDLRALMQGKSVLDAGCGSGVSINQFVEWPSTLVAADISEAVDVCKQHFGELPHVSFMQADLRELPLAENVFDVVWSNGVLHHTPGVFDSLKAITRHAKPGGLVIFYIYVKKAPIREFVDDYFRKEISTLPPEVAWQRCEALTKLGRSLSAIKEPLTVEDDVPELGIKSGVYNLQRFLYYDFFKCYWNDGLSFEDNVHLNFDWYHPTYAHRHSSDEVRQWLPMLGLAEVSLHVSDSGIGVVARKDAPRQS